MSVKKYSDTSTVGGERFIISDGTRSGTFNESTLADRSVVVMH